MEFKDNSDEAMRALQDAVYRGLTYLQCKLHLDG